MTQVMQDLTQAAEHILARTPLRPAIGLVLGSGLGAFAHTLTDATAIPFGEIPHFPTSTAIGHKGELVLGRSRGVPVAVMAGRVHFYEGYSLRQVVFPVRVLGRLGAFAHTLTDATAVPFGEIPHFPTSTAIGHKGELVLGRSRGVPVAVMAGRVHFYEGYSLQQVIFPVRVLGRLGVRVLVLTNAAGAVNTDFKPGELMVLRDHLNLMGSHALIGPNDDALGPRFPDLSAAYDPALRAVAEDACRAAGVPVHGGVYAALTGPSYETPAEIRMLRTLGADAVGMSTVPEVIAARHMGLRVAALSCLTNMAAGVLDQPLDHREVLEVGERVKAGLMEVLARIVSAAAEGA